VTLVPVLLLLLFLVPVGSLFVQGFALPDDTFTHLWNTVLGGYVASTLSLVALVLPGVLVLGSVSAWLVARHDFPLRKSLSWMLLLPFASPPYILAYVYTDAFQGVFPDIRSLPVAAALFAVVLSPYVYLLARATFLEQSSRLVDAARVLGCSSLAAFFRVALPLARPSLVAGAAMATMEVVADFGTVEYFAIDTMSTGVYRTWFALGSKAGAARLALILLACAFVLLGIEKAARRRARYFQGGHATARSERTKLSGTKGWLATAFCALPVVFGFALPTALLSFRVATEGWRAVDASFGTMALRSFSLALVAGCVCCGAGALLAWSSRNARGFLARAGVNAASLGYAMPGAVLAVGVLFPLGAADAMVGDAWQAVTGVDPGLLLSGTAGGLVYAYAVRFGAIPLQSFQAALGRVTPSLEGTARVLGATPLRTFLRVHLPLTRASAAAALVLVFVDVVKELPATLLLRPFDFDTLAVHTYHLASDERLTAASPAALLIMVVGILPVIVLQKLSQGRN
jgi:iron(III) transport system permease protein